MKVSFYKKIAVLGMFMLLSNCVIPTHEDFTNPDGSEIHAPLNYKLEQQKNTGLIVGSVTVQKIFPKGVDESLYNYVGSSTNTKFFINNKQDRRIAGADAWTNLLTRKRNNDLFYEPSVLQMKGDGYPRRFAGQVFVFELPPGTYYVPKLSYFQHSTHELDPPTHELHPPFEFVVKQGKVTYIGSLHADLIQGPALIRAYKTVDVKYKKQDHSRRDITIFRKHYVNLRNVKVDKKLMRESDWKPPY